uniref:uncharacterized protein LOC122591828 n=1 Tax=Erigeron canadensis TaxID=72917 RepID=UPI001CB957E5|nr:uncharacterized protein LOC122591828 [Erigeron canadensis]
MFEEPPQPQQQFNFLFQQNSVRGLPVRDHEELFQPNVNPFHITSSTRLQQTEPMSWPQQMHQQQQRQQQVNRAVGENVGNHVGEENVGVEREMNDGNVDESPTFWTTCPYCLNMYEHYRAYVDCILRCENCKRAFQAVQIPSPPDVAEDQETYFCCWGYYPIGVSMMQLGKQVGEDGTGVKSDWNPFTTLNDVSSQVKERLNDNVAKKPKLWEPWVYIDDVTDDIFDGISDEESSDDSDDEWGSTKKRKPKKIKRVVGHKKKERFMVGRNGKNAENSIPIPEGEEEPMGRGAEGSKKAVAGNPRRQSGRVAKEMGKLDLNVEFNNNEGEEPVRRMAAGNRGNGQGDENNVEEGIGFFEGLDEFLSNLPILSVNDEENVKDS